MKSDPVRNRFRRPQPPGAVVYLIAAAVILVSLEALIYLVLLKDTVGPFAFFGTVPQPAIDLTKPARVRIVVEWEQGNGTPAGERRLALWEKAAASAGIQIERLPLAQLDEAPAGEDVIVLPAVSTLTEAGRDALLRAVRAGAGLVISGSPGIANAPAEAAEHALIRSLTGATVAETVAQGVCSVTFAGGRFFSDAVPAGRRVELPAQDLVILKATAPDAYLSDHRLQPLRGDSPEDSALAVHATFGAGRVVWFGFDETVRPEHYFDQQALESYMAVALRWTGRQAVTARAAWPGGRPSAALVAVQIAAAGASALELADLIRQEKINATYFVSSQLARTSPALVMRLGEDGEVGSTSDSEEPLVGKASGRGVERLRLSGAAIQSVTGKEVRGLAPPQGLVNTLVIAAMNEAGYRYVIGDRGVSQAVPDIVEFQQSALFPLQRSEVTKFYASGLDDFELLAETTGDLVPRWLRDFRLFTGMGGLYTLRIHDDLLGAAAERGNLTRILTTLKSSQAWIASGSEIARWWSARQKIEVSLRPLGPRRLYLEVANKGLADLDDVAISVYLPYRPRKVGVRSPVFRLATPEYRLDERQDLLHLRFSRIPQQTSYIYYVTFDE